jgi:cyanate permease
VGGALCVIVLTSGLSAGTATGFRGAFLMLAAICVLAAAASTWLWHAERRQRQTRTVNSSAKKGKS